MHRLKPVHAYIAFAVVVALVAGKDQARQYDNQIMSCERGNIIREAIVNNSQIIRSSLRAAITADAANPMVVDTYPENIRALTDLIAENGSIDCEDEIDKPHYLP